MLYQKKGDTVLDSGKVFTVGGEVFANHACDYEGLFGTVTETAPGRTSVRNRAPPTSAAPFSRLNLGRWSRTSRSGFLHGLDTQSSWRTWDWTV